jgi:hypothetical protein
MINHRLFGAKYIVGISGITTISTLIRVSKLKPTSSSKKDKKLLNYSSASFVIFGSSLFASDKSLPESSGCKLIAGILFKVLN